MKELCKALMKAQETMPALVNNAINPHFRNNYATLDQVIACARPALAAQGIAVVEYSGGAETTRQYLDLWHAESGDMLPSSLPLVCKDPSNPQQLKSAQTYARRMLWISAAGLAPVDEDDDGAAAAENDKTKDAQNATQGRTQGQTGYTMPPDIQKRVYDAVGTHGQACGQFLMSQGALQPGQKLKDLNKQWTDHILSDLNGFVSKAIEWSENQQEIN